MVLNFCCDQQELNFQQIFNKFFVYFYVKIIQKLAPCHSKNLLKKLIVNEPIDDSATS